MSYFIDAREIFGNAFRGFVVLTPLTSAILYGIDPVLGIAFLSSQYLAELLQSTVHEWYHNPVRHRKAFYSFPVYWLFTFLERIGLASTKRHNVHHRHQVPTLDKVEGWLDLYVPLAEVLGSRFWNKALERYVPGNTYMTQYVGRAASLFSLLVFSLLQPALYAFIFLRYFG
jgi:hypothetical protein